MVFLYIMIIGQMMVTIYTLEKVEMEIKEKLKVIKQLLTQT